MTSPSLRLADAICPHATAVAASQPMRGGQGPARRAFEAQASVTGVQASIAANGRLRDRYEPATGMAIASPPTVAEGRERPSLLRNEYMPSPPRMGCRTMYQRIAAPHESAPKSSIGATAPQPDWGSAAKGTPAMTCGFQAGMWPAAMLLPSMQ